MRIGDDSFDAWAGSLDNMCGFSGPYRSPWPWCVPQWCLTAPCVPESDADTNAFDVGVEPCVDEELPVLDEDVADLCDVAVVDEVKLAVKPLRDADVAVELVDDFDAAAV